MELCTNIQISTTYVVEEIIPGWDGKQKGLLQILFERGMIDPLLVKNSKGGKYSRNGKKTDYVDGKLSEEGKKFSLEFLMNNCVDFLEEKTDLEHLADSICEDREHNSSVAFTPKFHCEIAGDGVEYSWGASKRWYRKQSFASKRSFTNFEILVMNSLKRVNIEMCRRFSRKAR